MHRVVNRSSSVVRHSAVFFCNCNFDALVETIVPEGASSGTGAGDGNGAAAAAGSGGEPGGRAAGAGRAPHMYPPVRAGKYILEKLGLMWD